MRPLRRQDPDGWIRQVFLAKSARRGSVVRRSVRWVENEIGREAFVTAVRARGFHMIECGGQFVVICNGGGLRVIC